MSRPTFRSADFATAVGNSLTLTMPADVGAGDICIACILSGKNLGVGSAGPFEGSRGNPGAYTTWPLHETIPPFFSAVFTGSGEAQQSGAYSSPGAFPFRLDPYYLTTPVGNIELGPSGSVELTTPQIPSATSEGDLIVARVFLWAMAGAEGAAGATPPDIFPAVGGVWTLVRSDTSTWNWGGTFGGFSVTWVVQAIYVRTATAGDVTPMGGPAPNDSGFFMDTATDAGPHPDGKFPRTWGACEFLTVPGGGTVDVHDAAVSNGAATASDAGGHWVVTSAPALAALPSVTPSGAGRIILDLSAGITPDDDLSGVSTLGGVAPLVVPASQPCYPLSVTYGRGGGAQPVPPSRSICNQNMPDGGATPSEVSARVAAVLAITPTNGPPPCLDMFWNIATGSEGEQIGLLPTDATFDPGDSANAPDFQVGHWFEDGVSRIDRVTTPTAHAGSGVCRVTVLGTPGVLPMSGPPVAPNLGNGGPGDFYTAHGGDNLVVTMRVRADPANHSPGFYRCLGQMSGPGVFNPFDDQPITDSGWTELSFSGVVPGSGVQFITVDCTFYCTDNLRAEDYGGDVFYVSDVTANLRHPTAYEFALDPAFGGPLVGVLACYKQVDDVDGPEWDMEAWGSARPSTIVAAPSGPWAGADYSAALTEDFFSSNPPILMVEFFGSLGTSHERSHPSDPSTERGGAIVHDAIAGLYGGLTMSDQPVGSPSSTMTGSLATAAPWAGIMLAIVGTPVTPVSFEVRITHGKLGTLVGTGP